MRVLIINYYFDPMVDAHVYRWSQIAKCWAGQGHCVDVICSKIEGKDLQTTTGLKVARVGLFKASLLHDQSKAQLPTHGRILFSTKRWILTLIKRLYRKIFWPDGLWHWLPSALIELYRRRGERYDIIVSYSPTFSSHLAVLFYKKIAKYPFKWIADYGDPFSTSIFMQPNNFCTYMKLNIFFEDAVIKNSSSICFTNETTLSDYTNLFGKYEKYIVMPHLVDMDIFYSKNNKCHDRGDNSPIKAVYVGGFHKNIRDPFRMLSLFKVLCDSPDIDIRLDIYGPLNGFEIAGFLSDRIKWHGMVERNEAINLIKTSDVLVNLENSRCSMVPSKTVEYIATGRPIVNIISQECACDLLIQYEESGFVFNYSSKIADNDLSDLKSFIRKKSSDNASIPVLSHVLENNLISTVSSKYLTLGGSIP